MLNKAMFIGRMVADPILNHTHREGIPVTSFSIAVERRFSQASPREVDFVNIVAWRHTAEFIVRNFVKGQPINIVGRLQNRSYEGSDKIIRYVTEIIADEANFAGFLREQPQGGVVHNIGNGEYDPGFEPFEEDDDIAVAA